MSITDELRKWAHGFNGPWKRNEEMLLAIADRIDAEHEAKVSYWQGASYKDGYDEGFASADDWLAQHEDAMAEHGWVKLPVSEDGDVLHIGELVDEKLPFGGYAAPAPIDTIELSRGASGYVWMVKLDAENRALISPKLLRHHHEPTVEDVLREFDGIMNYSTFFADAYCPDCRVRFEFQKVRKGKNDQNNLKRARKAFGGRA